MERWSDQYAENHGGPPSYEYIQIYHILIYTGAWTDIFLGGATSKFARGARENFIALHLDFIALHLGVERYTSRWSAIKFSRATKNVTQHLN